MSTADLLTYIGAGVFLVALVGAGVFAWFRDWQKKRLAELILNTNVTDIRTIAEITRMSQATCVRRVLQMVTLANNGNWEWRLLRRATVDINTMQIILADVGEPIVADDFINKAKTIALSKLSSLMPSASWTCPQCGAVNSDKDEHCAGCNNNFAETK